MDRFGKPDLQELIENSSSPCLSLYMPTYRAGAEIQQNPIRFKNLLKQAEEQLLKFGLSKREVEDFLDEAGSQLLLDEVFWQQQSDGLAVFITPDSLRYFRLPLAFEEMVQVGEQFYIKPLFKVFQNDGHFYILAISQDDVRLLEGTKYGVEAVDIEHMPESLAEALRWDESERQPQFRLVRKSYADNRGGGPQAAYHGHGGGMEDYEKTNILRYFQKVDRGLQDYLAEERAPLILAGVEYLFPIYQEANEYNHLVEEGIPGNADDLRGETLQARAWKLLEPVFKREQDDILARYQRNMGQQNGLASNKVGEIVRDAYSGRVESLIVQEDAEIWGRFDVGANIVEVHPERQPASVDLIDLAAVYTHQNNGDVISLPAEEMPGETPVAALYRY